MIFWLLEEKVLGMPFFWAELKKKHKLVEINVVFKRKGVSFQSSSQSNDRTW